MTYRDDPDHARARAHLPLLQAVTIASPCKESWASMKGSDRVRFCGRCEKNVFDLSEMTAVEAESVLAAHGAAPCVRFYRRTDGTVMTSDCSEGQRLRRRRQMFLAGALTAGTLAGAGALAFAGDGGKDVSTATIGTVPTQTPYEAGSGGATGYTPMPDSLPPPLPPPPPPPLPQSRFHAGQSGGSGGR